MRNYWLRIALGAAAIFTVGMIGVTLARQGASHIRGVVESSDPITLPVAFIPFKLDGQKLGNLSKVVLLRDAPKRISSVEVEVKLKDSVLARGLEGCHLAANFDSDRKPDSLSIRVNPLSSGVFSCLDRDSVPNFQRFGRAVFQPGNVTVPLLLPDDIVNDLKHGRIGSPEINEDSIAAEAEEKADSISDAAEALADSIATVAEAHAESVAQTHRRRLVDSIRNEGMRRADSALRAARRIADSVRTR